MATKYWIGRALAVAQVGTFTVTAYDVATTYSLTVGGKSVSTIGTGGTTTTTAAALVTAWNASTSALFSGVTASNSGAVITLTADTAGVPFTATSSATGGTGTIGSYSATTAATGPNFWDATANWSGGVIPVSTDDVVIDSGPSIAYGLAQSAVALASLTIKRTFSGRIGLNRRALATSANGETTDTVEPEYRAVYLAISATTVRIGDHDGTGNPSGSGRIMLDLGTGTSSVVVRGTASAVDSGLPAVRLLNVQASSTLVLEGGSVGVAVDSPAEVSTLATISTATNNSNDQLQLGQGTTVTTVRVDGGILKMRAAATVATLTIERGEVTTDGDYTVTTLNMRGGTLYPNHVKSAGNAITTANLSGGRTDARTSGSARTWATVNFSRGATLRANKDVLTITTPVFPTGAYEASFS